MWVYYVQKIGNPYGVSICVCVSLFSFSSNIESSFGVDFDSIPRNVWVSQSWPKFHNHIREEIYIFPLLMIMNCKMENTRHHLQNFTTSTHIPKTWYITKSRKAFCNNYMSTRASCTHYHLLGFIIYLLFEIANFTPFLKMRHTLCGLTQSNSIHQLLMVNPQNFLIYALHVCRSCDKYTISGEENRKLVYFLV